MVVPRPLRIEHEGAFYRVMSPGNERRKIFFKKADDEKVKSCLNEAKFEAKATAPKTSSRILSRSPPISTSLIDIFPYGTTQTASPSAPFSTLVVTLPMRNSRTAEIPRLPRTMVP